MRSMTGYGKADSSQEGRQYLVEIKSVNHKYSDISIKMPRTISFLEDKVRKMVLDNISRGKIDVCITYYNYSSEERELIINREIAKNYIRELKQLAQEEHLSDEIPVIEITKYPDVLTVNANENEEVIWSELRQVLQQAIRQFVAMREKEAEKIKEDLKARIQQIQQQVDKISKYSSGLVEEYVVKLEARIKEILKTDLVDETRLAQEVVIYSDKCSVEEELTRLKSHISQFLELIEQETVMGKKLDFIVQEMNRETNTIGSKANCLEITNLVIDIKTELENIREQIQNIE